MKIRCKFNKLSQIKSFHSAEFLKRFSGLDGDESQWINLEQEYTVYGIIFRDNHPFYYVFDDPDSDEYPVPVSAVFFEITDHRLSKYWRLFYKFNVEREKTESGLFFEEWANDIMFYEKLIDGNTLEVQKMSEYKILIKSEFEI